MSNYPMMNPPILITGASGNVGSEILRLLQKDGANVRAPSRLAFDFQRAETFSHTFANVERMFLMRPPAISDVGVIAPALIKAKEMGVRHIVFLSLLGAEKNRFVPHHKIEDLILELGTPGFRKDVASVNKLRVA